MHGAGFTLTRSDIKPNAMIDKRFEANVLRCSGQNKSPALKWSGAPKDAKHARIDYGFAGFRVNANQVGKASFTAKYGRSQK